MLNRDAEDKNNLHSWLNTVHSHLEQRRAERNSLPRPKRNRERERARREARMLFREFYSERALQVQ